jgi:probable aminopeptidase NPEPL1
VHGRAAAPARRDGGSCILAPVTSLSFPGSTAAALSGADEVLVVAPARTLARAFVEAVLGKKDAKVLRRLAEDLSPGARGACASTLGERARWLRLGVLPDEVSRHNCPARAEAIRHLVSSAGLGRKSKVAIVLVLEDPEHQLAAANAVGRALPAFSRKGDASKLRARLVLVDPDGERIAPATTTKHVVAAARACAELVDTPPTELDPAGFAAQVLPELRARKGVHVREIVGPELAELGLHGIHAVGRAAVSAPRMIVATWRPKNAARHVALVGKGVTFDTGGLHIKARGMMEGMKGDMGGAAAVFGAFTVLVDERCPDALSLVLCIAENAVAGTSYKPDDILRLHSGKTVEINNTDAEGRLLLSDGVSWAARELHADIVIDAATLTGAQLVSTGLLHAAVVSDDADLEAAAVRAGRESGDLTHPLPFAPELFQREFQSPIADMRNSVANRMNAQSSCAAQFIYSHMSEAPGAKARKWLHVDLAGPAFPKDRATGFGVALLVRLVSSLP